ncbi:unnamed protein product [Cunninghamella echinulata]
MAILCCSATEEDELVYDYEEYNWHIVPHLMQNNQWDCGLACVAMVLHSMNINTSLDELTRHCAVDIRMVLPLEDFKRFLYCKKFVLIALVNARYLKCVICKEKQNCLFTMCGKLDLILDKVKGNSYLGHFIVLIGYDPIQDMFIYRDPTINSNYCAIPASIFDKARQSEGTDHDCLVIQLR